MVAFDSHNSNCVRAFSSLHLSTMLAYISLPSLWIVVFVFRDAIMYDSDYTLHTWLKSVCSNSTVVQIHCTPYCNIYSKCTNRVHDTKLGLSVLGVSGFWAEITLHSIYSITSLPTPNVAYLLVSLSPPPLKCGYTYQSCKYQCHKPKEQHWNTIFFNELICSVYFGSTYTCGNSVTS